MDLTNLIPMYPYCCPSLMWCILSECSIRLYNVIPLGTFSILLDPNNIQSLLLTYTLFNLCALCTRSYSETITIFFIAQQPWQNELKIIENTRQYWINQFWFLLHSIEIILNLQFSLILYCKIIFPSNCPGYRELGKANFLGNFAFIY